MEKVLVFPTALLRSACDGEPFQGVLRGKEVDRILEFVLNSNDLQYMDRDKAENDPDFKQIIPYCLLDRDGLYLSYRRTKKGGDSRLYEKWSIGIGGHINPSDADPTGMYSDYEGGFFREIAEETGLLFKTRETARGTVIALINDDSDSVGRVHFGIVHQLSVPLAISLTFADPALERGIWTASKNLLKDVDRYENWSRLVIREILAR